MGRGVCEACRVCPLGEGEGLWNPERVNLESTSWRKARGHTASGQHPTGCEAWSVSHQRTGCPLLEGGPFRRWGPGGARGRTGTGGLGSSPSPSDLQPVFSEGYALGSLP